MKTSRSLVLSCFVLSALAACGGSTSGSPAGANSVTGTVAGITLDVGSEFAALDSASSTGACTGSGDGGACTPSSYFSNGVSAVFTNRSDETCAAIQSEVLTDTEVELANLQTFAVTVNVANGNVVPGTYDVTSSTDSNVTGAGAVFITTTSTCGSALSLTATSGTVTVTQFNSTSVVGTYAVTFGTQGSFSGSFDLPICDLNADAAAASAPTVVCKP